MDTLVWSFNLWMKMEFPSKTAAVSLKNNASNMSGKYNGIQALIREKKTLAEWTKWRKQLFSCSFVF